MLDFLNSYRDFAGLIIAAAFVVTGCETVPPEKADTMTSSGLKVGSIMTEAKCSTVSPSVWVIVEGKGDCLRYFPSGVASSNDIVNVFFHGDRLKHHWDSTGMQTYVSPIAYRNVYEDGLRANASTKSHAELDEAEELDDGNPEELGGQYRDLRNTLTQLSVLGGCCGTDHRHIEQICKAWTA